MRIDPVEGDALLERERDVHGLLARHRVEDEQHVRRLRRPRNAPELLHQLLVDVQAAGGVEDHDVEALLAGGIEAEPSCRDGIAAVEREDGKLDLLAELLELVDRRGALEIASDEAGPLSVSTQEETELRSGGRLSRALEPREQDHRRRAAEREPRVPGAHEAGQLLVDDLHDLLARA